MKIYNNYILSLAILLLLTTVILAALGQESIEVYFVLYILEVFVVTEIYVHLNAKARRGLNSVGVLLFAGFMVIVVQKIIAILV